MFANSLGSARCRFLKPGGITCFHLISEWRTFDICDRRFARLKSFAPLINSINRYFAESCRLQLCSQGIDVVVPMRGASEE